MYKYEMHLHSSECSRCAMSNSKEMVDAAVEHGYSGIVFTNHFIRGNTNIDRNLPWGDFIDAYKTDYESARIYGESKGLTVLFGIEEGIGNGKEVLIYGLSPDDLKGEPQLRNMPIDKLSEFVHKHNGFIACAHPFRARDYIKNPDEEPKYEYLDGAEVYNHFNTNEENEKALKFAKQHNLTGISGGDIHAASNFGVAGIETDEKIKNNAQLVKILKSGKFRLIKG